MKKPLVAVLLIFTCCSSWILKTAPGITVVYDDKKKAVTINWQQKLPGINSFIIQRSADNINWTDIAFQATVNFNPNKTYQYLDYKAAAGENYYRLKCITDKEQTEYSASIIVVTGKNNNWVMYPVPVKDVLTLQYKGSAKITGVVNVFLQSMSGQLLKRIRSASLNTVIQIPVDNLGKGVYDVRIVIENEVVWNQRFIK
jgi:Secretion system C-terminal sorting domain